MSSERLLHVEPRDLCYTIELKKQPSCSVKVSNKTQDHIAFKVRTTSVKKYRVRPYIGILSPGSSCDILVTMLDPFNLQHEDMFLIKGVVSSAGATKEDIQKLFKADAGLLVQKSKLGVVTYVLTPEVPLPVAEESSSSSFCTPERKNSNIFETIAGELLDVHPSELRFPFEVKELSCSLKMSNMTENRVGFKVRTTDPDKYIVRPNIGIVLPQSTCDITVRSRAQSEILLNMECKDKFLIKSIIASPLATSEDITPNMFNGTAGAVDKIELGVFYVRPSRSSCSEFNGTTGAVDEIEVGEFYVSPSRSSYSEMVNGTTGAVDEIKLGELHVCPLRSSYSEWLKRYAFEKGVIVGQLSLIVLYLIWKMLPLLWSLTFLVMKLMVKMMQKLVSDSVEDWVVNICAPYLWALLVRCIHCLPVIFGCSIPLLPVLFRRRALVDT